ncbi:putative helicase [Rhodoblastus acidophilus]|uniref:DEAD/DEAH box helicase n=1 Tax=Rhodoblastus acidophilus TaxID=1074 RepID=UPI0022244443|nr:type ISP restriction/modification enzyme [Rhodoblastus acidophilus]MCW2285619.1 putative helicase [Rhodoblastus acidophilus]MCW2334623.1 putative helicase [Rhodoblastus acidophilus]
MPTNLRQLLEIYRKNAASEREKGAYFEQLTKVWLENAPTQKAQFSRVLTYAEWARENRLDQRDTGIDLVAQLSDSPDDWCAVQCKFYREGYRIQKSDIDSFFTASGRRPLVRRMIVDTTDAQWSEHANAALDNQTIDTTRVGLSDLEDSGIDWATFAREKVVRLVEKKQPRPHQTEALAAVQEGLKTADRGKLIMACGTGKTYTALKIAEAMAGKGARVLFLVPSLSLMSQTIREWSIDCVVPLRSFAVCSDVQVGVRKAKDGDLADIDVHDLEIPATTHGAKLAAKANAADPDRMTVVFSTYQSIQAIHEAQANFGLPEFDLIVCDEAHRTTGVTLEGEDESNFVRVHNADYIKGAKRLYMTATPRIFGDAVKRTASDANAVLCSMDNPAYFGETLFTRNFSWAVQNGLLTDYKVIVLAVDEEAISATLQKRLADENSELILDDATKIVGCYKALTKADLKPDVAGDTGPMRRALAFTRDIKRSKLVQQEFERVAEEWRDALDPKIAEVIPLLDCEVEHVDGSFSAHARNHLLSWLKEDTGESGPCRILTNARCLSEGVDVPALDAIMFLHPRKSQIDVVQSVGRVMRRAEGKKMGYVILPVGVPAGVEPEKALDDNEKYKVVWQILNALRAHDDRFDATINKIDLGVDPGERIEIVAVTNTLPKRAAACDAGLDLGRGSAVDVEPGDSISSGIIPQTQLTFGFDEFSKAIMARIVKKCGTRTYWEDWATDVARIAEIHVTRIRAAVRAAGSEEKRAFETFLAEIRDDLNDSITEDEAIEMLAQHLITRPVFDALFEGYSFAQHNPVSKALQSVLDVLDRQNLDKEATKLDKFYASVKMRAQGIEDATAKQKIVVELYDKFFKAAFPKLTARLGIVYTPVEVVDFIIKSVDEVLQSEFGQTLGSEGVHIIDPFVGTGTFITRLLQSGLITPEQMARKYRHEIHANEIVLLAYYIAAINIEAAYHEQMGGAYEPFPGICLTDTFQLWEKDDLITGIMADNSTRRTRQKKLPIKVIIGNPPYSAGQKSANDNAANVRYDHLDQRIRESYAAQSNATNKNALYNSYIRAIRWASDRLSETGGVMAFVTDGGWFDGSTMDGLRKCLRKEATSLHVFHLRGNQRTSGERSRKEGGKIFGQGSRQPVVVMVMVINPASDERGKVCWHDVGDYLSREQKLAATAKLASIGGITRANGWSIVIPDEHGDWLSKRDENFNAFLVLGNKENDNSQCIFENFSRGVATARDAWAYNYSRKALTENMRSMIAFYNSELHRFKATFTDATGKNRTAVVDDFVDTDTSKISWNRSLKADFAKERRFDFSEKCLVPSLYRPFMRQWLYYNRAFNDMVYQMPRLFAIDEITTDNLLICVPGTGGDKGFSALLVNAIPDLNLAPGMGGYQCFPRYIYDGPPSDRSNQGHLLEHLNSRAAVRRDAITDVGLKVFTDAYPDAAITKDDVFYYVYGLLHSEEYRERYADNLSKQLPRIPLMKRVEDFRAFVEAGRRLGDLHVDFESVEPYPVTIKEGDLRLAHIPDPVAYYRVEKMKFAGKRGAIDKTTVVYNPRITMTDIPLEAYDYVVNGKPALEWVMERQCVKTDPASGIVNDANRYAIETVGDPAYPLMLFCRVITVSLETMRIVRNLPALDILEPGAHLVH